VTKTLNERKNSRKCTTNHSKFNVILVKGKGKVVPVLLLTEHHATKAYWGS